ncbi:MAG TPA: tetratricopeptide repeat protein [Candidatus Babeliales bacterium]|nr:tetratricopeptide repeat protein [Candidatus Babeliales bacterium]
MMNRFVFIILYLFLFSSFPLHALFERDKAAYAGQRAEWEKAREILTPLVVNNVDDFVLLYDMGVASYKVGDYEHAQGYFDAVINAQSITDQLKEQACFNAGNSAVQRKQLDDAIAYYEHALSIVPNNERTKHNLEIVKKMRDEQKKKKEQEKEQNDEQKNKNQDKQEQQKDQQDKKHDDKQQDSSGNDEQQNDAQRDQDRNDGNQQKNKQNQQPDQSGSNEEQHSKQQSDQNKEQGGNPQNRQNNEKKQQQQQQGQKDLEGDLQDKPGNEHKNQNEHKTHNQNEKNDTQNIAKDSKQNTAEQKKEQADAAAAGKQGGQKMAAVERTDALNTVDEWLATILKKREEDDAQLNKCMIKAAVGEQLAGQDGQNCW